MSHRLDLVGKWSGRLLALAHAGSNTRGRSQWLCLCSCGEHCVVTAQHFTSGTTAACGCLGRERARDRVLTHGESRSPEYASWVGMVHRCTNPRRGDYRYYGGRGITVCSRWLEFRNFLADMGRRPSIRHTLERRDNNAGYSPDNCYWATKGEQARNTRRSVFVSYGGRTQSLADWASELHLPYSTIQTRHRAGWPPEEIINGRRK
jgi:hypothetical protein